jgi:hypothetical protein
MSNGAELCCILGICCPPALQLEAVSKWMTGHGVPDANVPEMAQAFIHKMKPVTHHLKEAQKFADKASSPASGEGE